jgi:putative glutamine amidotransferase
MGRPIIGITCELEAARWGDWVREAVVSPVTYTRVVERAGGAPVLLPPVPPDSVSALISHLDGLLFTGGRDVDPALYDQQRLDDTDLPEHRRDRFELLLMRAAIEAGRPFLAIGRGLHVLTVACGGTLIQHLPDHRPERARYLPHDVLLADDSVLGRLFGGKVQAPAAHHQAPDVLGTGLKVTGWSPEDQAVEALELDGHVFGVAVHWHPEESDDPRLLAALVEAASQPRPEPARQASQQPRKSVAVKPKAGARARLVRPSAERSSLSLFSVVLTTENRDKPCQAVAAASDSLGVQGLAILEAGLPVAHIGVPVDMSSVRAELVPCPVGFGFESVL